MTKRTNIANDIEMEKIRSIILRKDRTEIDRLRHILDTREELSQRVAPIIEQELKEFKEKFPREYEQVIHKLIDQRIKESQDAILDIIYPMMGKMIKKFVNMQFNMLREQIDGQVKKVNVFSRLFNRAKGIKETDVVLSNLHKISIEEVYVIQKNSGLLLGSASRNKTVDADSVAGMLTAIKLFVEDAFQQEQQNLEIIQYETYEIFLQNFHTYTIAIAVNGSLSTVHKAKLKENLFSLGEAINPIVQNVNESTNGRVKEKIEQVFMSELQEDGDLFNSKN